MKCDICNKEYKDTTELVNHLMKIHTYVVAYVIVKTIEENRRKQNEQISKRFM